MFTLTGTAGSPPFITGERHRRAPSPSNTEKRAAPSPMVRSSTPTMARYLVHGRFNWMVTEERACTVTPCA